MKKTRRSVAPLVRRVQATVAAPSIEVTVRIPVAVLRMILSAPIVAMLVGVLGKIVGR